MSAEVTEAGFDEWVAASATPVVLQFYATWCGNCRRIAPELDALAGEFEPAGAVREGQRGRGSAAGCRFDVMSTPTLFVLADGERVRSVVGAQPAPVLRGLFETAVRVGTAARLQQTVAGSGCGCDPGCGTPSAAVSASGASWVPAEACALPTSERPMRMVEFETLFSTSLISHHRESAQWLRLRLSGGAELETAVRELISREAQCCSFFDFHVGLDGTGVVVDVRVPQDKVAVLDGLAAQAEVVRAARV